MHVNADFHQSVLSKADTREWVPSPAAGVERQMLDRVGEEVARATSLVRYAPNSRFPSHAHDLGEEFLVLEGTFADEHGSYPAGTYVRNPPGTAHSPRIGEDGCTIFVKLRQFDTEDLNPVNMDITDEGQWADIGGGVVTLPLHGFRAEDVFAVRLDPGSTLRRGLPGGAEVLVLDGELACIGASPGLGSQAELRLEAGDWLRLPAGSALDLTGEGKGARFYLKTGHLTASAEASTA